MTIFKAVFQQPVRGNMSHIASKTFLPMRLSDVLSVALVACLLFAYVLSYYPFIFQAYIPRVLRISIEGATLLLLLLVNSTYTYHKGLIWYLIFISISIITILLGLDLLTNVIFSYNKMMFFVLAIGLFCGNRKALDVCIKLWLRLWFLFCVMAILAFVGHNSGILNFLPLDFSESLGLGLGPGERYFLHNPILGNLSPKRWFGVEVGRVAGFMFEPGLIAFFFGFNILVASDWIKNQRVARRFVWLNYMAGFATISVAFILIMGALLFGKRLIGLIRMEFVSVISILLGILLILFLSSQNITEMTSLDARLSGFYQILTIIENNTLLTFLFGNGVGVSKELFDSGIDSGWMGVFVERGMVMLIFMIFLLVNFTRGNVWLMLYIMFYSLSINMFWSPVALLGIALNYALFFHIRKSHFASWPLAARPLTRTDAGSAVERRF